MKEPEGIRTLTMARIYSQQGHHRKALEIYRYLASNHPERSDIREELAHLESKAAARDLSQKNLDRLVVEWVRLASAYRQLQTLKEIKQKLVIHREAQNEGGQGF